jgi:hypothetical protein
VHALTVVVVAGILLWIWTRFAEFWLPSVAFYAGVVVFLAGALSVLVPLRFVGISTRRSAVLIALSEAAIGAGALYWPVTGTAYSPGGSTALDQVLPAFDRGEQHEILVKGTVEQVRQAVEQVTFSDIRGYQTLMSLRAQRRMRAVSRPVLSTITAPGGEFIQLAKTDREFVAGNIGTPWAKSRPLAIRGAEEFRAFTGPRYAKIAFNMRVQEVEPGWCKLSTETRARATDDATRTATGA